MLHSCASAHQLPLAAEAHVTCACALQHVEVLAFTCTTVSTLATVIHYISVNVIRSVGEGHLCDPADHTCEQNFNLIVIT